MKIIRDVFLFLERTGATWTIQIPTDRRVLIKNYGMDSKLIEPVPLKIADDEIG